MKKYSQEFKDSAAAVYEQGGVTYKQLGQELGVCQLLVTGQTLILSNFV